jgi:hypothetical protein
MGAWNYNALDNDSALEVIQRWQEWVVDPAGVGYEEAIERYFKYWGDSVNYGDAITNMEIIALLAIHLNEGRPVPKRLVKAGGDAINRELVPEELNSWKEPEQRKDVLLKMLAAIGGKVKPPKLSKSFSDASIHYKNTAAARQDLLRLARIVHPQGYTGMSNVLYNNPEVVPPFLRTLHRLMMHCIWEKDWKIEEQASLERRMMLAWYLGLRSGCKPEEIAEMLDRCVKK